MKRMGYIAAEVGPSRVRLLRSPLYLLVAALTGVAPTYGLFYVHRLGREGVAFTDWRVLLVMAAILLVVVFYAQMAAPVVRAARVTDAQREAE